MIFNLINEFINNSISTAIHGFCGIIIILLLLNLVELIFYIIVDDLIPKAKEYLLRKKNAKHNYQSS